MIAFTHQGTPVSPGQALDVWLQSAECKQMGSGYFGSDVHLFADATDGYCSPVRILKMAGIEITFGDEE